MNKQIHASQIPGARYLSYLYIYSFLCAAVHFIGISCLLILSAGFVQAQPLTNPYNWVIPTSDSTQTSSLPPPVDAPAGKHGFLATTPQGHFQFQDGTPVKFWGVTMSAYAVFPDSADAIIQAAHLQKYGFNIVRMYAFDYGWQYGAADSNNISIFPDGLVSATTQQLDQRQMKRLDWFMYQLKLHGIYTDFTFSCYRTFRPGDTLGPLGNQWDSIGFGAHIINYFDPGIQYLNKQFAQMLLTHVNQYTNLAYTNDPAIALIELTDANPLPTNYFLGNVLYDSSHHAVSDYYSREIDTAYNQYLRNRYGSTAALAAAWNQGATAPTTNLLPNGSFEQFSQDWYFFAAEGNTASDVAVQGGAADSNVYMRIAISQVDSGGYGIYLTNNYCTTKQDSLYTVSFYAKTSRIGGRQIVAASNFGFYEYVQLDTSWQFFTYVVRASATYPGNGTLGFYVSQTLGDVMVDGVKLQRTPEAGLISGERLENNSVMRTNTVTHLFLTDNRLRDESRFYDSAARAYCDNMRSYVRDSLGAHIPVSGINIEYLLSDVPATKNMDFVSTQTNWDTYASYSNDSTWTISNNSLVKNEWGPMTTPLVCATKNKPLVISQYDEIYPNVHQTESALYMPAYAAYQQYDAIFWYYYAADKTKFNARQISANDNYELMHNSAMMSLMPSASYMFRNGLITHAQNTVYFYHDTDDYLLLPKYVYSRSAYGIIGGINTGAMFVRGFRVDSLNAVMVHTANEYEFTDADSSYVQSDTKELNWDANLGILWIDASRVQGGTGFLHGTLTVSTTNIDMTRQDTANFGTYLWVSLDTNSLANAPNSLLTLSTNSQNTGTKWNATNTTLTKSGSAPVQIGGMSLAFNFRTNADTMILYPLDSLGKKTGTAIGAVKNYRGEWRIVIDQTQSQYKTPWFFIQQKFGANAVAEKKSAPASFDLSQNSPNPFDGRTTFTVTLPESSGEVNGGYSLKVYDYLGREVADLSPQLVAGASHITFASDALPTGVYRYTLSTPEGTLSKTMVLIK